MLSQNITEYTAGSVNVSYFYGKRQKDFAGQMDLISMQIYRKQFINFPKLSNKTQLYLTVYNLDPSWRKGQVNFTITIGYSNLFPNCPQAVCQNPLYSCACSSCAPGKYGEDCSLDVTILNNGGAQNLSVNGPIMKFFQINENQQVSINIKQSNGTGEAYFQFVENPGQFASYTNVKIGRSTTGNFSLSESSPLQIGAVTSGTPISITIVIYDRISTNLQIYYSVPTGSNILVIVLGILGGVLFIGLVIAACYIIRNSSFGGSRQSRIRPANQGNLSSQQIQRFFPKILMQELRKIKLNIDDSMQNLNQMKKQESFDDCAICICGFEQTQFVNVLFCKHIFHQHCITGWFKKHQSCPQCREQYTRTNSIKFYKKLKQANGKSQALKGEELIKAILTNHRAVASSNQILVDEKEVHQIQVASRNTIEVEDMNA